MSEPTNLSDEIKCLLTWIRHKTALVEQLEMLSDELRQRGRLHDLSKLRLDEFSGFTGINQAAREHPYGSEAYRAVLFAENKKGSCIALHFQRNRHHPEFWDDPKNMTWVDLIEMVFDWNAAAATYGQSSLVESLQVQRKRFKGKFTEEQWWLIEQVVAWLSPPNKPPLEGN